MAITDNQKYVLVPDDTIEIKERGIIHKLYRIRAIRDLPKSKVRAGDLGGYIESMNNLSHLDDAWVYDSAKVYGDARVRHDARISGNARVYGNAIISDRARVYGNARVHGHARIFGDARIYENANVYGEARIFERGEVYGNARVFSRGWVFCRAQVYGSSWLYGNAFITDLVKVCGKSRICGEEWYEGFTVIEDNQVRVFTTAGCDPY